jgi:hypothetical protein
MPGMREGLPRVLLGAGWVFALGTLASAFAGWQHVSLRSADVDNSGAAVLQHAGAMYAPWLLIAALALTGAGLLTAL